MIGTEKERNGRANGRLEEIIQNQHKESNKTCKQFKRYRRQNLSLQHLQQELPKEQTELMESE